MVKLARNDAGNGRFLRAFVTQPAIAPQLLLRRVTFAEVANHSRKALQFPAFVSERHREHVGPKLRPILPYMPALVPEMPFSSNPPQFIL